MREDIQKWLEALRSGGYRQAKGALEFNGGFCCLGVYCKVNGISYTPAEVNNDTEFGCWENNTSVYGTLRELIHDEIVTEGIGMNDEGKTFAEIADMIEREYSNE